MILSSSSDQYAYACSMPSDGARAARSRCGDAQAFDLLRRVSQRSNVAVRDLAAQIVATTEQSSPWSLERCVLMAQYSQWAVGQDLFCE
jgi:hypothetical protein